MDNPDALQIGMLYCKTSSRYVIERPLSKILDAISRRPELDMLLAPEWFFVAKDKGFYSPQEFAYIKRRLERATKGLDMLLIPGSIARLDDEGYYRNTSPVISNGETILEYSKRENGSDRWFAEDYKLEWKMGEEEGIFRWRDYAAGIEICADHGALMRRDKQSNLDFQFVVASGKCLQSSDLCVREGGIALLCDGDHSKPKHEIRYLLKPEPIHLASQRHDSHLLEDGVELRTYKVPAPGSVAEPAALEAWLDL